MRPGGPAPWADLAEPDRKLTVEDVRAALARTGPARRSAREGEVTRSAAVLAALYDHDGEGHVILTRRSAALRVHSGEVSFPGGRRDHGETLAETALREAHEEVDLPPEAVSLIGELDHLSTVSSDSFIVPFVGSLTSRPHMRPNPAEVDAVLHVALSELLDPAIYREEVWFIFDREHPIYFFELMGDTVWGATAAMLRQLLGLATSTLVRGDLNHL